MKYDSIVVSRGLMGSATAKHLSIWGYSVALVGPKEPTDRKRHRGQFSKGIIDGILETIKQR